MDKKLALCKYILTIVGSHDTFNRVYQLLNPLAFQDCLMRWTQGVREMIIGEIVAIDGKAQRRARNKNANLHYIVNAWAGENRLLLGQYKVSEKSNEIIAIPEFLRILAPICWISSWKRKHPAPLEPRWHMRQPACWKAGARLRKTKGEPSPHMAKAVRGHWGVENCCHWVLDVIFKEDESRACSGHATQNLGTARGIAMNQIRKESTHWRGIKGRMKRAGCDSGYLEKIHANEDAFALRKTPPDFRRRFFFEAVARKYQLALLTRRARLPTRSRR